MSVLFQTVTAVNYLPLALVLAESLRQHLPGARLSILITDASPAVTDAIRRQFGAAAEFLCCDDLGVDALPGMRDYYGPLEFSSACKVLALDYQLRKRGEAECHFIDPDVLVLGDFAAPTRQLGKDIVVTYHARAPYPGDGEVPAETDLIASGSVNGGFIYARRSPRALEAVAWLAAQTRSRWFVAPTRGMYGDQHWLSFLPQFFADATGVLMHPGINIAYWNLHERPLRRVDGRLTAGGEPALLFHFSGFPQHGEPRLTQHSNRRFDTETEACLTTLTADYRQALALQRQRLAETGIAGDLAFSRKPLPARLRLAESRSGRRFMRITDPVSRFGVLAPLLRLWRKT